MIFAAVRTLNGGFQTLNITVMEQMRGWLIESMGRALAELGLRFVAKPVAYRVPCVASWTDGFEDSRVIELELFEKPCLADYDGQKKVPLVLTKRKHSSLPLSLLSLLD